MVTDTTADVVDDGSDAWIDRQREWCDDTTLQNDPRPEDVDDPADADLGVDDRAHMLLADITSAGIALDDTVHEWTHRDFVDRIDLLEFAVALSETVDILTTALRHVRAHANGLLTDGEELTLPGGWTAKPGRPSTSYRWDAERLREAVGDAMEARILNGWKVASEHLSGEELVDWLCSEVVLSMFECLSNSQSSGWKTGGLKKLGISPDRFREKTDASPAMAVLKRPTLAERVRDGEVAF